MSYYRPSFSQTVAMTRGRGFVSSYRGSGGRSWGGPPERGRGGYGSSRGGRFSSSFSLDNRSKYASADRYSGGSRDYDDYHHKSYRSDMQGGGYPGRDGHRSPERKRLRPEAPSRRSHEADSFSSSGSRYQSNSFMDHRSFSRDRRPSSFSRRDDFRKPSGPPPSSSPRGGYRGRISSRGVRGARLREGPPRRRLVESSYAVRRRIPTRIPPDYARRLKMSRLRSAIARRTAIRRRQESDKEDSDEKDIDKESDEEEVKKEIEKGESDNEETGENKEKESPKKSPKKEVTSDKEDKGVESDREDNSHRKDFIKLVCPHCNTNCITFSKYSLHLHNTRHMTAMRHVAMKQKSVLARMRLSQRNTQRELEKTTEDLAPRTNFCPLCKLNYKQPKATHQASDSHKSMKKFLMPYCRVCRITFKSPMLYETHICSIEHIKRKSRTDVNGDKSDKEDGSGNDEDNLENFMTIDSVGDVDDEEEGKKKEAADGKPKEHINVGIEQIRKVEVHYCELCRMYLPRVEEGDLERTLAKHCRQRTHMQRYIRYKEDKELANRAERLQRKETAEKEREKNKVKEDPKTGDEVKKPDNAKAGEEKEKEKEKGNSADEEAMDDKLWADDVNKDLGDILAEAESGNKSSDEDEDSHADGERYDSEKNGDEKKKEETEGVAATATTTATPPATAAPAAAVTVPVTTTVTKEDTAEKKVEEEKEKVAEKKEDK